MTDHYVYGLHAVAALLTKRHRSAKKIFVNEERADQRLEALLHQASEQNLPVERLSAQNMNQRFAEYNHQGIVALADALPDYNESDLPALIAAAKQPCLLLILDGVTDPHNLGACLRSADAVGVDFVIIPKDRSASITPVVSKVASGAAESIPLVRVTNLVRSIELIKKEGVWVFGASGDVTETIYDMDFKTSVAVVMGAEGKGIRRLTREHCDALFALPMSGCVESLNVSVATGVSLYEVVRQRRIG
jgi:23S rRNA (guanosine2251-2'-O)-methyltransferase